MYLTNVVNTSNGSPSESAGFMASRTRAKLPLAVPGWRRRIAAVKPEVIVCLGATAAQALPEKDFRVTQHRGEPFSSPLAPYVVATVHPSSILRAPDDESRARQLESFVADLRKVAELLAKNGR